MSQTPVTAIFCGGPFDGEERVLERSTLFYEVYRPVIQHDDRHPEQTMTAEAGCYERTSSGVDRAVYTWRGWWQPGLFGVGQWVQD